jgi:uncharacterized membrane protein
MTRRSVGSWVVIIAFGVSGVGHLVNPSAFLWLMPPWLPGHIELIYLSGVAELLAAAGLVARWRFAPLFTVGVLLAVWPANWWFAIDSLGNGDTVTTVIAWLRLPLQIPLMWWAWRSPVKPRKVSPGA